MNKMSIENQRIFLAPRMDLGVGGCCLNNPCSVRILNPFEIVGRSLSGVVFQYEIIPNLSQTVPPLERFVENEELSNILGYVL